MKTYSVGSVYVVDTVAAVDLYHRIAEVASAVALSHGAFYDRLENESKLIFLLNKSDTI